MDAQAPAMAGAPAEEGEKMMFGWIKSHIARQCGGRPQQGAISTSGSVFVLKRWTATISYRHDDGIRDVLFGIEELGELQEIVESGPRWDSIEQITITLRRRTEPLNFTVEDGERK